MSILYIDGFEWVEDQVQAYGGAGRWTTGSGTASYFDVESDTASGGGLAIQLQASADLVTVVDTGDSDTLFVGVRFRMKTLPSSTSVVLEFPSNSASNGFHLRLYMTNTGHLRATRYTTALETAGVALSANTWYYLEVKVFVDNSVGTFEVRVDGSPTPIIDFTGDTMNGGTADMSAVRLEGNLVFFQYDDFYMADAADSQDFLGDVAVYTIVADGAGTDADFTPLAGSNHQNVEELPQDNSTYNESDVVDDRDRFTFGNLPADTDAVYAVQVGAYAQKDDAGAREIRLLSHDGTTERESAAISPGTDWQWHFDLQEDHPSGASAWTESEVNGGQFGYTVES